MERGARKFNSNFKQEPDFLRVINMGPDERWTCSGPMGIRRGRCSSYKWLGAEAKEDGDRSQRSFWGRAIFWQYGYLLVGEVICAGRMEGLRKEEPPGGSRATNIHWQRDLSCGFSNHESRGIISRFINLFNVCLFDNFLGVCRSVFTLEIISVTVITTRSNCLIQCEN